MRKWLAGGFALTVSILACVGDDATTPGGGGTPEGGTGECTSAQKTCNGTCVSKDDPSAGCAAVDCTPCAPTTNAAPACKGGICSFACNAGAADCDGDPKNGCESKTDADTANCGACAHACGTTNTDAAKCAAGKCDLTCKAGFGHCTTDDSGGCETDTQKSADHCGKCGHSCLGGQCVGGKCQPFQLASVSVPSGVAVDKTHVYFTFPSLPLVQRVQRDGKCTPASPCPQDFGGGSIDPLNPVRGPSAIVSDGTFVWWTNQATSKLVRRSTTLPPAALTTFPDAATSTEPGYLVIAGGKIFWTNAFGNADPFPHVNRADMDGTNHVTVAFYQTPVATFKGAGQITADATTIYWANMNGGVYHQPINAAAPCTEGTDCPQFGSASSPYGVAVDATFVYWTEPQSGTIRKATKTGGQSTIIATGQDNPRAIAAMDNFVYWGNIGTGATTGGSIRRTPQVAATCDGAACELVTQVTNPEAIVASDDGLYWTDNKAAGGVYRLAK
jgi:hypothetical protein